MKKYLWFLTFLLIILLEGLLLPSRTIVISASTSRLILMQHSANKEALPAILLRSELVPICRAESDLKQFNKDGSVLRGIINHHDIGICQISETYWLEKSKEKGYNIYTLEGNIRMANWIYSQYGDKPWFWSKSKWQLQK